MSTHKAGGSKASQHVNPAGKRLGVKMAHGEAISAGEILVRQRGTLFRAGKGVKVGRDHSLFAMVSGRVNFATRLGRKIISVV